MDWQKITTEGSIPKKQMMLVTDGEDIYLADWDYDNESNKYVWWFTGHGTYKPITHFITKQTALSALAR